MLKKCLRKNCPFTAAVVKKTIRALRREWREAEGMFERQKDNYKSWQSTLRTLSELCCPSGFICPQAEQKRVQKTILQGFLKSEFIASLSWNSSVLVSLNMLAQHARRHNAQISLTQHWAGLYIYLGCWHSWNFFCWWCQFFCGTSEYPQML